MTKNPALKEKYSAKGESYLKLAEQTSEKWVKRGGWRETKDGGMISVTLPYGLAKDNAKWIDFDTRNDPGHGFSHPDNKANLVARWMLAMWDVTGKPEYRDRAEKWFRLQKSRLALKSDGTYEIWNYWQPAGPWDYKADGKTPKHWVGVHPNGGYYQVDTAGMVDAYEHGLVFTKADIDRLIDTAKNTKVQVLRMWSALAPYDVDIQKHFEATEKPDSWGGLAATPYYLMLQAKLAGKQGFAVE
jgi:hypothetical protein